MPDGEPQHRTVVERAWQAPRACYLESSERVLTLDLVGPEWPDYRFVQLAFSSDTEVQMQDRIRANPDHAYTEDNDSNHATGSTDHPQDPDGLSAIAEEDEEAYYNK